VQSGAAAAAAPHSKTLRDAREVSELRHLSITKAGNARLRVLLIELAWRMVLYQPQSKTHSTLEGGAAQSQGPSPGAQEGHRGGGASDPGRLWRWQTGRVSPEQLGWRMVTAAAA
jgi:hypothetical protein